MICQFKMERIVSEVDVRCIVCDEQVMRSEDEEDLIDGINEHLRERAARVRDSQGRT